GSRYAPNRSGPRPPGATASAHLGPAFCPSYPLGQLACHAGARLACDARLGTFRVEELPDGVHLAGSVAQVMAPGRVAEDGAAAGRAALLGRPRAAPTADVASHPW